VNSYEATQFRIWATEIPILYREVTKTVSRKKAKSLTKKGRLSRTDRITVLARQSSQCN